MASSSEDLNLMGLFSFPAGQLIDGLDPDEQAALTSYFGGTFQDQAEASSHGRSAGQNSSEDLTSTAGKSTPAFAATEASAEDGSAEDANYLNDNLSISSDEDVDLDQKDDVQDEGYVSQPLCATIVPSEPEYIDLTEESIFNDQSELKGFESATFSELDDYGKETLVVDYINDHSAWFFKMFAQDDNVQELLKQHPQEVATFLHSNIDNSNFKDIFDKCSTLFAKSSETSSNDSGKGNELVTLLIKHKDDGTLGKIFEKHPMILAHALKSIDDSHVLFKFFSKHKAVIADWLERHKNIETLAAFFDKYPAAINKILDEEPAIVENFLQDKPDALHIYLDAHPEVLEDYLASKAPKFQQDVCKSTGGQTSTHRPAKRLGKNKPSKSTNTIANTVKNSSTSLPKSKSYNTHARSQLQPTHKNPSKSIDREEVETTTSESSIMGNHLSVPSTSTCGTNDHNKDAINKANILDLSNIDQIRSPITEPVESLRTTAEHEDNWAEIWAEREKGRKEVKTIDQDFENIEEELFPESESEPDASSEFGIDDFATTQNGISIKDEDSEDDYSEFGDDDEVVAPKKARNTKKPKSTGRAAATKNQKVTNKDDKKKGKSRAPKNKPVPWSQAEQDSIIRHMLAIRDEGVIDTEERFIEAAERMKRELGVNRTSISVKNFWSRTGRERSGYDERKRWNRTDALATSLQGKRAAAKAKASLETGQGRKRVAEEEEGEEVEKEEGGDEEGNLSVECRAAAIGTRQKKRVKYTF